MSLTVGILGSIFDGIQRPLKASIDVILSVYNSTVT